MAVLHAVSFCGWRDAFCCVFEFAATASFCDVGSWIQTSLQLLVKKQSSVEFCCTEFSVSRHSRLCLERRHPRRLHAIKGKHRISHKRASILRHLRAESLLTLSCTLLRRRTPTRYVIDLHGRCRCEARGLVEELFWVTQMLVELRRGLAGRQSRCLLAGGLAALQGLRVRRLRSGLPRNVRERGSLLLLLLLFSGRLFCCLRRRGLSQKDGWQILGILGHRRTFHDPLIGKEANHEDNQQTDHKGVVHSSNVPL